MSESALEQWELTFTAKNYLPICGVSTEKEGIDYWSNNPECDAAMMSFNGTSAPSEAKAGIYDTNGNRYVLEGEKGGRGKVEDVVGVGIMRCLCFGVKFHTGKGMDICLLMGGKGEVVERKATFTGNVAVGMQNPQSASRQNVLPTCDELAKAGGLPSGTGSAGVPKTTSPSNGSGSLSANADANTGESVVRELYIYC